MTAEIRNDVIVATEHIKAPPEVVFPYFTDPALIITWIGDRAELDPQPGGVFSLDMGQIVARGAYLTVDPPYRVAFSWGIRGSNALPPGGSTVEVVLTPDGDDTMVVLTHRGLPSTHIGDHRAGWDTSSDACPLPSADPAACVVAFLPRQTKGAPCDVVGDRRPSRSQSRVSIAAQNAG